MESLSHSTFANLDRITQLLWFFLETHPNPSKSTDKNSNSKRFVIEKQLQRELGSLKGNVKRLTQTCESLQNENKVLKRMVTRSNSSFSAYSAMNMNGSNCLSLSTFENGQSGKYPIKVTSSKYSSQNSRSNFSSQQDNLLPNLPTPSFNLHLSHQSPSNLSQLKQHIAHLTQNLQSITKAYQKYQLDSTTDPTQPNSNFLAQQESNPPSLHSDLDLQHLLCDESLSFDQLPLQQRSSNHNNTNEGMMVESLIAKGIEFRESRTLRSKEYQTLSDTIRRYRDQVRVNGKNKGVGYEGMGKRGVGVYR